MMLEESNLFCIHRLQEAETQLDLEDKRRQNIDKGRGVLLNELQ